MNINEFIPNILRMTNIHEAHIVALYPYGSRVYGTHSESSDHDFIVVYDGDYNKDSQQFDSHDGMISVHTHSLDSWKRHVSDHKIFAMECIFLGRPTCYPFKTWPKYISPANTFGFKLDKSLLRKEISSKASNSWVKCKKKLTVEENEYNIGIKSLFHSFRIPMFGIQLAKRGKISHWCEATDMWFNEFKPMLVNKPSWEEIKQIYQPRHNQLMTEFRGLAEK